MNKFVEIRPAHDMQVAIYLAKGIVIQPTKSEEKRKHWIRLPEAPTKAKKHEAWNTMMETVLFYWKQGTIEINGRIRERDEMNLPKREFFCTEMVAGSNRRCPFPAFQDGLCAYHWFKRNPEVMPV